MIHKRLVPEASTLATIEGSYMKSPGQNNRSLTLVAMAVAIALSAAGGCKGEQELTCAYAKGGIKVDGLMADWEELPTSYFEEQGVVVGMSNDDDYLYLMFRFRDQKWARAIRMSGLTLWFDGEGKKGKDYQLNYRGGPDMSELMPQDENTPNQTRERMMMMNNAQADELTCAVKDRIVEMPIEVDGSNGPQAACGTDLGFFVYEFRVPLREGGVRYYGVGAEAGATITIGANWGKMERGNRPGGRPPGGMGGGPPGGGMPGGGRPGGGMGGGPPGGMGGERPEIPEEQEIWFKTTLAVSPGEVETE